MKRLRTNPAAQRGASLYAMIVVMTLLGILIFAGLKISPAYLDNQVIKNALQNLKDSGELERMPLRDVRAYVTRTMQANGVDFDSDSIDQACEIALTHDAFRLKTIRQLIQRGGPKQAEWEFIDEHPIIRSLSDYEAIVKESLR